MMKKKKKKRKDIYGLRGISRQSLLVIGVGILNIDVENNRSRGGSIMKVIFKGFC